MAIYAQKGSSFEATAQGFASGLVGTIGVRIIDNIGGTTLARTTTGIAELIPASGFYGVTLTAPAAVGEYSVVWDDTQAGPSHTAAETLTVMSTTTVQVGTGTQGMTFGQILDDVLDNPLRFEAEMRPRAGRAVNLRYAHVWALEDWTFRFANTGLTATGGILAPAALDFGTPVYLWGPDGTLLLFLEQDEFMANYASSGSSAAQCWTIVGGQILLGPTPPDGPGYRSYYRRRVSQLVDESAYPMLPPEFHLMLVHGGRAELLSVSDDPMTGVMEDQFKRDIDVMRAEYLIDALGQPDYWPDDLAQVR